MAWDVYQSPFNKCTVLILEALILSLPILMQETQHHSTGEFLKISGYYYLIIIDLQVLTTVIDGKAIKPRPNSSIG